MGLLNRAAPKVTVALENRTCDQDALEAESSSSVASSLGSPSGPDTPAGGDAASSAAAARPRYWPSEAEVAAVLNLLSADDRRDCDEAMANRYLRATGGDQQHAAKRVADTLAWRRAERPEHIVCTACMAAPKSHYMQVVGHDRMGRPLIYSCLALATNRDVEDNRRHMISTFEQAIRMMPQQRQQAQQGQEQEGDAAGVDGSASATPPVESWCWVLDMHGFSVRDCDPRLAKIFLNLSAAHYPERLGTFFVVSAPTIFNTLWRAISHFIDPVTKQKIHFVNFNNKDNSKLAGLLHRYFDARTTGWLLREMEENRTKAVAQAKAYSYPDLSTLAAEGSSAPGVAAAREARRTQSTTREHDHLGSPGFLESLEGQPDVLLPHLRSLSIKDGSA